MSDQARGPEGPADYARLCVECIVSGRPVPDAPDESGLAGTREGQLAELGWAAGLREIEPTSLTVSVRFPTFAAWWGPFTLGVGPAGAYVAQLDQGRREVLRSRCQQLLPPAPFEIAATAWCVRARA